MSTAERYECIPAHLQEHPEDQVDDAVPAPNFEDTLEARFCEARRVQQIRPAEFASRDLMVVRQAGEKLRDMRKQLTTTIDIAEQAGRALRMILDAGLLEDSLLKDHATLAANECEGLR